jgi:hypothetical protein
LQKDAEEQFLVNGTSGTIPKFGFTGDSDTGMGYDGSSGNIIFIGDGTENMRISSTYVSTARRAAVGDGTAASPAYSFGTDTDTGYYRKAANTPSMVAGGIERYSLAGTVTTTDATTTTVVTVSTATGVNYQICWYVVGRSSTGAVGTYTCQSRVKNVGGVVTTTHVTISASEEVAAWNVTSSTSGTNVLLRVVGVAATTINWKVWADIIEV